MTKFPAIPGAIFLETITGLDDLIWTLQ